MGLTALLDSAIFLVEATSSCSDVREFSSGSEEVVFFYLYLKGRKKAFFRLFLPLSEHPQNIHFRRFSGLHFLCQKKQYYRSSDAPEAHFYTRCFGKWYQDMAKYAFYLRILPAHKMKGFCFLWNLKTLPGFLQKPQYVLRLC